MHCGYSFCACVVVLWSQPSDFGFDFSLILLAFFSVRMWPIIRAILSYAYQFGQSLGKTTDV